MATLRQHSVRESVCVYPYLLRTHVTPCQHTSAVLKSNFGTNLFNILLVVKRRAEQDRSRRIPTEGLSLNMKQNVTKLLPVGPKRILYFYRKFSFTRGLTIVFLKTIVLKINMLCVSANRVSRNCMRLKQAVWIIPSNIIIIISNDIANSNNSLSCNPRTTVACSDP